MATSRIRTVRKAARPPAPTPASVAKKKVALRKGTKKA